MKKLISIICAAAMLMCLMVMPAGAEEEFETEVTTSLEGFEVSDNSTMEIVNDVVDGVERPVVKWTTTTSSTSDFGTGFIGTVMGGTYRLTVKYYCPFNPGEGRFGMRNTAAGGFPDNSPEGTITQNDGYTTVTRDITVQDNNTAEQYVRMRFAGGEFGTCYIAEFKAQLVLEDGTLGANILPEFYVESIKGTTEGWTLTGANDDVNDWAYAEINGLYKPVVNWAHRYTSGTTLTDNHFRYDFNGPLAKGDYRISITYWAPQNPGNGRIGLRNDSNGGFPGNNTEKTITQNSTYETKTRDVTVTDDTADQFLDIDCSYGAQGRLYIAEVKLQAIDEEGNLGENLIANGDFMQRKNAAPDPIVPDNLMFDVVDNMGSSMTGGSGIDFIPPSNEYRLSASVNVENNSSDTINPVLIIAMYYEGRLCDVGMVRSDIGAGQNEDMAVYLTIPDTVGEDKLVAKAFLWEDLDTMVPVAPCIQIEEME